MNKIIVKPGREKSLLAKHPWLFSGAILTAPEFTDGDILPVYSSKGDFLGQAMANKKSQIFCRMLCFDDRPALDVLRQSIKQAIQLRKLLFKGQKTNALRLINAEGDFLPGLIVDQYANALVLQFSSLGMERLKSFILDELVLQLKPEWVYEKSNAASRKEEGLSTCEKTLYGIPIEPLCCLEDGLQFYISVLHGQKTGFFLDQRAMRALVGELSYDKKVLNCFSYTGGFSLYALRGGATVCDSVDISKDACELVKKNIELNGLTDRAHTEYAEDVFEFLKKRPLDYDLIILDPPAFAKRRQDIQNAARGYKEINLVAMKKCPPGSLLLSSSCSYHIDEKLFCQILFSAAKDAKRNVQILERHRHAFDHPVNIYHPEGSYLKSLLCYVQ